MRITVVARTRGTCLLPLLALGCKLVDVTGNAPLPLGVPDPTSTHTPAGALAAYEGAILQLRTAVGGDPNSYIPVSGVFTDEFRSGDIGQAGSFSDLMLIDSRVMPEFTGAGDDDVTPIPIQQVYGLFQKTRGQSREARGALMAYYPKAPHALVGHLYAIEGYADLLLADFFCSGVPLSTLNFGADFTDQPGSSTATVYQRAITLFDSALTDVADSARMLNMARVGKGRALLALGQYAAAATAVAQVPDEFQYVFQFNAAPTPGAVQGGTPANVNFAYADWSAFATAGFQTETMVDREGGSGLPFMSSGDPRSAWMATGTNPHGVPMSIPTMYAATGDSPIVFASGVEARLIGAEAALDASSGSWLTILNALRTDGTFSTQPDSVNPTQTDTLWNAGTGGVPGLKPLADPGDAADRVTMLFDERGFWLFLTGHRQGDLRRLIRQYGRQEEQVYPAGFYPGAYNTYGTAVTAPIPGAERISNPLYTGCQSRGA